MGQAPADGRHQDHAPVTVQPALQLGLAARCGRMVQHARSQHQGKEGAAGQSHGQVLHGGCTEQPAEQPGQQVVDAAKPCACAGVLHFAPEAESLWGMR
ncbi:hypothetical protein D3C80_1986410 [compost metagenome]